MPTFDSPVAAASAVYLALRARLRERVVGTYLHGSAALGGFVRGRSDTDVLVVVADDVVESELAEAADALRCNGGVAGVGIELSVITASAAAHPVRPWPFLVHVVTGPGGVRIVWGSEHGGDADLVLHVAVARDAATRISGPPPTDVFGRIDHRVITEALIDELAQASGGSDTTYATLNACRAWQFAATGALVSKLDGARWALALADAGPFHGAIRRAVDHQLGEAAEQVAAADVERLAGHAIGRLEALLRSAGDDREPGVGDAGRDRRGRTVE